MEIKFRAFNRVTNTMLPNNTMNAICINSERLTLEEFESLELMQFTGFYDKTGKEIYDGDILGDWTETDAGKVQSKQQVFWNEPTGSWHLDNSYGNDKSCSVDLWLEIHDYEFKILGNIYENASLIAGS